MPPDLDERIRDYGQRLDAEAPSTEELINRARTSYGPSPVPLIRRRLRSGPAVAAMVFLSVLVLGATLLWLGPFAGESPDTAGEVLQPSESCSPMIDPEEAIESPVPAASVPRTECALTDLLNAYFGAWAGRAPDAVVSYFQSQTVIAVGGPAAGSDSGTYEGDDARRLLSQWFEDGIRAERSGDGGGTRTFHVEAMTYTFGSGEPIYAVDILEFTADPFTSARQEESPLVAHYIFLLGDEPTMSAATVISHLANGGTPESLGSVIAAEMEESSRAPVESLADSVNLPGTWVEVPGPMYGVVVGGPGFVATGRSLNQQGPKIWSSTEGVEWVEQYSLEAPGGYVSGAATTPAGLVAVGALPCQVSDCERVAVSWTSIDGLNWQIAYRMSESLVPPGGSTSMWGLTAHGNTVVASVESCPLPDEPCINEVLASVDGVNWSQTEWSGGDVSGYWFDIAVGGSGLIAIGQRDNGQGLDGAVWLSEDGISWDRVQTEGLESAVLALVAPRSTGLIAVSSHDEQVFTSTDGIKWSQVAGSLSGGGGVRDLLTLSDGRILAVGSTCNGAAAWISQDGSSWSPIFLEGGGFEVQGQLRAIAEGPAKVVVVGAGSGTALIWAAEPDSISTVPSATQPAEGCQ